MVQFQETDLADEKPAATYKPPNKTEMMVVAMRKKDRKKETKKERQKESERERERERMNVSVIFFSSMAQFVSRAKIAVMQVLTNVAICIS